MNCTGIITRFAPSPNGQLHLGHAFSAIIAHDLAMAHNGSFVLRIEDIDGQRSRPELAQAFREDLAWLGLTWAQVAAQSARIDTYAQAAERLKQNGLLYPCSCTRAQIEAESVANGPDGPLYSGRCRAAGPQSGMPLAWRVDMAAACTQAGRLLWEDDNAGPQIAAPQLFGDIVLMRKDAATPASYHLAATLDDAADGVTLVTRGKDLFAATHIHRLLQALLNLPVPRWHHHPLLRDAQGRKLAKRRRSSTLADLRAAGVDGAVLAADLRAGCFPAGISRDNA